MSLKVRNYAVIVGQSIDSQPQQATNEDTQHVFSFVDAPAPLGSGAPIDLTDATTVTLTAKDSQGQILFQVVGAIVTPATAGKAAFTVLHGAFAAAVQAQPYSADVLLVDNAGKQSQLVATPFRLIAGVT